MGRRIADSPLVQLTLTRIREFGREPEAIFWTFVFPILMAFGLGIAFQNRGPEAVRVGVTEDDHAEEMVETLRSADGVEVSVLSPGAVSDALRDGDVAVFVRTGDDGVTYRYDPGRPESRLARLTVDDVLQRAAGRTDVITAQDAPVQKRGARYIDFLIPGLIGLNLLSTGLWGVGYTVVRMRTGKLLKRLMATPMRRSDFLLSFMLGRLGFLAIELAVLLLFAYLVFEVSVAGSVASVGIVAALGAFTFTGLGLLVASRARTTEGVSGLMNLAALPMWLLSGVFFSTEHFPELMQPFIDALPLTALLDALRAIMNDGASIVATSGSLAIVAAWGAACFGAALASFRWQ